jgi:hypothetical protein
MLCAMLPKREGIVDQGAARRLHAGRVEVLPKADAAVDRTHDPVAIASET